MFERDKPRSNLGGQIFWNLKSPISISIEDDSGIKSLKIVLSDGTQQIVLVDQKFDLIQPKVDFEISLPKGSLLDQNSNYSLDIEVADSSMWNFFRGNRLKQQVNVIVDTKKPVVYALNQSYKITRGGTATVVFSAEDEMLKDVYIETNFGKRFEVVPFHESNYYAGLIAWPVEEDNFRADIVALDMAGNETKTRIRYYLQDKTYKISNITLSDDFIEGKITDLFNQYASNPSNYGGVEKFKFVNETLRNSSPVLTHAVRILEDVLDEFYLKSFYPLKNGAAVASYGDHRFYEKDGVEVSQSWHLGLDLASVAGADIINSNDGIVVFSGDSGIYGLSIVIYHGFGLYTLYSHCSSSVVGVGDRVLAGDIIGSTGSTGLAFGDHLHFGVIVQGVEVRPEEWMDSKWMQDNVYQILESSKKIIDNKR
ncbi:MAG: M23 family metallopeptidase [Campylobacter sp.]|nr:M23 family metallopeptidase [Campylobacter sp.]